MQLRNQEIVISDNLEINPFDGDQLDREQYAHALTSVLKNYNKGFVLALNSEWGTGKTTFVKMWMEYLKRKSYVTIYFNAWENDFQDEVVIAILSELKKIKGDSSDLFAKVLRKVIPLLKNVGIGLFKHAMGKVAGDKTLESIAEGLGQYSVASLQKDLDDFDKKKNSIEEFREVLKEFVKSLDNDNPIIFVIDELDRCRPNYAVEVLEKMKHLFSVEGIVFVLSIDKIQLGHAIRGVYGSESIDSNEYLRRFIDLEFSLPKPNVKDYTLFLTNHFGLKNYYSNPNRPKEFETDMEGLIFMLDLIQNSFSPTLRQLEKMLGLFSIVVKSLKIHDPANPMCILFIILLKTTTNNGYYQKLVNRQLSLQELLDITVELLHPIQDENKNSYFLWFQGEIVYYYWKYLYSMDRSIVLYEGNPYDKDFKIMVDGKSDDKFNSLEKVIGRLVSDYRSSSGIDLLPKIIPHINLSRIVN
ncbi:P-loop NTPase fold protein [Arenibacter sp. M-2]|uniref:KAP family P-loop NTPase fold protein n=1 Tax=Arenibacter sp. M-2 TaxID=3053612 RepID=UPI00257019E5|nr:P-loop NTPase fold protein [Arenibacter sp. M-2]MDL5514018.1 P-loop NTPase fold protein [Arenibacter sp. M-2]